MQAVIAADQLGLDFEQRAGRRHFRPGGEHGVELFVEAAARPDHLQVGGAGQGTQAALEFAERRLMHRLHGHAQRHAEDDGQRRQQGRQPAPGQ